MIGHEGFARLRLAPFRPDVEVVALSGFEFLERRWVGEGIGFSEWLRLEDEPEELRSLAIDFAEFPPGAAAAVLAAIDLPLRPGMRLDDIRGVPGGAVEEQRLLHEDRVSHEFTVDSPARYNISCTVLHEGGLTYLVVTRPSPGTPC
jgi:hypothetical protein